MTLPRIIGLGSHHGDDQAGWLILDRLRELGYPSNLLRKAVQPTDLLDELPSTSQLLICDACNGSGAAGTIHQWQWPIDSLLNSRSGSTHDIPLAEALELAEQFANHRLRAEIWAVTGSCWVAASNPSTLVQRAAYDVAAQIWDRHRA